MQTLDFRDHRRVLGANRYVYAVVSRRVGGLSIGINLNPDKACNFACPYCQVDRTVPGGPRMIDLAVLAEELDALLTMVAGGELWDHPPFNTAASAHRRVGDISFAGDGEPTAAPHFAEAIQTVADVRARFGLSDVPLTLLTNATRFHIDSVVEGLEVLRRAGGQIWAKLDAGTEAWFQRVDATSIPFDRVLKNLRWACERYDVVLQSMFHAFGNEGPTDEEILAWARCIEHIMAGGGTLSGVQVYTVARAPADPTVVALPQERLQWIAEQARAKGVSTSVY